MSRVLVIDDDDSCIELVRAVLSQAGYEVVATADPRHTQAILEARAIDAIVLDLRMPHLSGIDVLRALRQDRQWSRLPIMILSGEVDPKTKVESLLAGADDYLTKPFDSAELVARLGRLMHRSILTADLAGLLEKFSVADLLQSIAHGAKTGRLWFDHRDTSAYIEWQSGQVIEAATGNLTGREALLTVCTWRQGLFTFEDGSPERVAKTTDDSLRVSNVLLEATWLEDQLNNRMALLPREHVALTEGHGAELSRIDASLRHLPFALVLDRLKEHPGITLEDLTTRLALAPRKVHLMVTILVEHGGVVAGDLGAAASAAGDDAGEGLGIASLVDALGGVKGQGVYLSVHVERQAWDLARRLIEKLPSGFAGASRKRFFEQMEKRSSAMLRLSEGQAVALSFSILESDGGPASADALLSIADALVLWLGPDSDTDVIKRYLRNLKGLAPETAQLAIVPKSRASADALLLQAFGPWRIVDQPPETLPRLLAGFSA